jgi:hypothetical protein
MRLLCDVLATFDVVGGVLLLAIYFQTLYVAIFRLIHGEQQNEGERRIDQSRLSRPQLHSRRRS